jgi:predicted Zn-dependent protease
LFFIVLRSGGFDVRQRSCVLSTALAAVVLVLLASGASAQGRISGVVNDENGKAIKAATVTAANPDTNQQFTATTDEKGRFSMLGLRPGLWRFTAQAPGYFADGGTAPVRAGGNPNAPISFSLKKTSLLAGALGGVAAKDLQADLAAADALFNQRKWDESIAAYKAVIEKTPSLSVINLQIAAAYLNKRDYDAAIAAYNDLLKIDSQNEKATVGIAKVELEKGDVKAAEESLAKAATSSAAGRETFYALGDTKFDQNEIDDAIKWYQKAADADPYWGKVWYKLGLCAQKKGDRAGAAQFMNKVLAVDPVSPEAAMAKAALDQLSR